MSIKKVGAIYVSSALALSALMPINNVHAEVKSVMLTEQGGIGQSSEASILDVDKEKLIARVKELFPNLFNTVSSKDFNVSFNPSRAGMGMETYDLHFYKEMGAGKQMNGHFSFTGKDLALISFYYDPADKKDALFPAKVTREEAQKTATKFLEKLKLNGQYQLSDENMDYYSNMNRPLTEPVMYHFTYDKLENGVPVQYRNASITVLGNGEVTQFYIGFMTENKANFESKNNVIAKNDALQILNDNLQLDLRYLVDYDYLNDKASVKLTYVPDPAIMGIHAKTKEFKIGEKFFKDLPKKQEIKMLASQSTGKSGNTLSKEEAKALAEKILKPKKDNVKLAIEGIQETERNGVKIYSIHFMYYEGSGGSGSSLEINKETGEILNYYNQNRDFYYYMDPQEMKDVKPKITEEQALKKAMEYLKQYVPSNLNQYAYPLDGTDSGYRKDGNEYYFNFPRIKDGIIVNGNGIGVSVSADDGELYSLNVNYNKVTGWPDVNKAIDREKALEAIKGNLDVKLMYTANSPMGDEEYRLVYTANQKDVTTYFNAVSGAWEKYSYAGENTAKEKPKITHSWASDELNFLLDANIIKVKDPATFNPDRAVSKGEALEILYKSLANFYDYDSRFRDVDQDKQQTYENIKPDHPLYNIIERAAEQKIIDPTMKTFNTEEKLTKEELAYWYVRALGLQVVADHKEIFTMSFKDTKEMNEKYQGHIALVNGLGIFTKDANQQFQPKNEVTLAELAVSNVRLAKIAAEMNVNFR
ncbi:PepSY1/2 domain-containing protein [Schinkia azotoformans]|uniref:PepSY1/2 domain-containing protein n=1 Tax=Schinkia azotoformans TaxID=1454 RepID=UPI002DB58233|nr:PepSY1/2 domain-containing protein [Schinkia azotoformans]MEC1695615.1 S-layer homology domain-containing protein [Schinkia azotoformans]MEC1726566.1 S-layer homology domain-containing protein [Schinkia azotoformans]MEC1782150.1 S-layer homology domain-containing protein [Schinkia azotoformans]MED4331878.1 S-layer homology domain-containing protein [Schinkia azotoformans]